MSERNLCPVICAKSHTLKWCSLSISIICNCFTPAWCLFLWVCVCCATFVSFISLWGPLGTGSLFWQEYYFASDFLLTSSMGNILYNNNNRLCFEVCEWGAVASSEYPNTNKSSKNITWDLVHPWAEIHVRGYWQGGASAEQGVSHVRSNSSDERIQMHF